jgi:hypothetical protein
MLIEAPIRVARSLPNVQASAPIQLGIVQQDDIDRVMRASPTARCGAQALRRALGSRHPTRLCHKFHSLNDVAGAGGFHNSPVNH